MNKNTIIAVAAILLIVAIFFIIKPSQTKAPSESEEVVTENLQGENGTTQELEESEPVAIPEESTEPTKTPVEPEVTKPEASTEPEEKDYVGLAVPDALNLAESRGVMFRIVEADGMSLPTTRDYRPGRINAETENGVVIGYTVEGSEMAEPEEDEALEETNSHDAIIGMTLAEAQAYAEEKEVEFRVGTVDGEPRALTMDYRPGRITAEIANDVVVSYTVEQ